MSQWHTDDNLQAIARKTAALLLRTERYRFRQSPWGTCVAATGWLRRRETSSFEALVYSELKGVALKFPPRSVIVR